MKRLFVLVCVVFCLLGCKEHKSATTSDGEKQVAPEQAGSTVRVRVLKNGLLQKDCTGALMRSDEFPEAPAVQGINRCALTLLRGWKEAQLRAPEIRFFVFRNQADTDGEIRALSHPAWLMQFDEKSGIAALSFMEKFDSKDDIGYRLERTGAGTDRLNAMISWIAPIPNPAFGPGGRYDLPLSVAMGNFESRDGQRGRLKFAPAPGQKDESPLCVSPEGALVGFFADGEGGEATLIRAGDLRINVVIPMLKPVAIAFGTQPGTSLQFVIHTEQLSGQPPKWISLFYNELSKKSGNGIADETDSFLPNETKRISRLSPPTDKSPGWRGAVNGPAQEGQELAYRVQIGWPAAHDEARPSQFARPFVLRLRREGDRIVPKVEGLENINETKAAQRGGGKEFPLEAPVIDFREFAGGREVLMQLGSAPFWKRFSFSRNDWEPLPPGDFSTADVAGNLNAIYILDRKTAEVRKHALGDLKLVASVKLPPGKDYLAIAAGSNSTHARVHVLTKDVTISLDPDTLQRSVLLEKDGRQQHDSVFRNVLSGGFRISGDGLTYNLVGVMGAVATYTNDAIGFQRRFFDWTDTWSGGDGSGVSGAFAFWSGPKFCSAATADGTVSQIELPDKFGVQKAGLVTSSPVFFRMKEENQHAIPPMPVTVAFQSYFGTEPFAILETPELSLHTNSVAEMQARSLAFDPYSRRLGSVSKDRKSWTVRQITADPKRKQPVLLNWPDTSLVRGGEFRFTPVILNGEKFSAELLGNKEGTPVKIEAGTVSFRIAQDELASLFLLTLRIPNAEGGEISCPIPLHVFGPQLPLAAPPDTDADDMDSFGAGFKTLARPKDDWKVLHSGLHVFRDPVKEIAGVAAGHLILISEANRVDFLSLQTGKITASFPTNATASYFAGADALFEYDSSTRSLSRISVPDGRREKSITLPGKQRLSGIALGEDRASPLTLVLGEIAAEPAEQTGDRTRTANAQDPGIMILDSASLQSGTWTQPKLITESGRRALGGHPYNFGMTLEKPVRVPTARDGLFISLHQMFISLGQKLSVAARYPDENAGLAAIFDVSNPPHGSLSGMTITDGGSNVFRGGVMEGRVKLEDVVLSASPCGRYRLLRRHVRHGQGWVIEVRTIENNRPLFRTGRFVLARSPFEQGIESSRFHVSLVAPAGPMVILSGDAKILQVVDLDIPKLAKELVPSEFHVTSQAAPCVMEGGSLDYQIHTNNPAVVTGFKLRAETEGATLSSEGVLHFNAPQHVTVPTKVNFSIEIVGKLGAVLQEFPVFVIPFPKDTSPPKPSANERLPL